MSYLQDKGYELLGGKEYVDAVLDVTPIQLRVIGLIDAQYIRQPDVIIYYLYAFLEGPLSSPLGKRLGLLDSYEVFDNRGWIYVYQDEILDARAYMDAHYTMVEAGDY